jgi:hypothetical protein
LYSLVHGREANPFGNSVWSFSKSCHISSSMFVSMEPLPGKALYSCGFRNVEPIGLSCAQPYIESLFVLELSFDFAFTATMNRLESRLRGFMRFRAMVSLISSSSCFLPGRNLIFMFVSSSDADSDADADEDEDTSSFSGEKEEEEEGRRHGGVIILLRLFSLMLVMLVESAACWYGGGATNAWECRMRLLERNINIFKSARI